MSKLQELLSACVRDAEGLAAFLPLSDADKELIGRIVRRYPMCVTPYYLGLIHPEDPKDPVRRMCIPGTLEFNEDGHEDQSGENDNTVLTGMQHKYRQTALILSTNQCAMYCRHCFRKRMVGYSSDELASHLPDMAAYVRSHPEINNVLISGGDAFINENDIIEKYLQTFSALDSLDFIRFGTRTPVVLPMRIYDDPALLALLETYGRKKQIIIVTHFNHPNELTDEARRAVKALRSVGCVVRNQTVLLKGINDDPPVLASLLNRLVTFGVIPYYIFQCRPARGVVGEFQLPISAGSEIVNQARTLMNGQAKSVNYVMSHRTGKIEILGKMPSGEMLFQYHQAKYPEDHSRIFQCDTKTACWLKDDLTPDL